MVQASVDTSETTRARLLSVARDAFLRNGFLGVSLRSIAALAQVTTGAIYGHFSSKEDLFDHVVAPSGDGLFSLYQALIDEFLAFPPEMRSFDAMLDFELEARTRIVDFIYDHPEDFLIIARGSAGTRWEGYLDRFVEAEKSSTVEYEATAGGQLDGIDGMRCLRATSSKASSSPSCVGSAARTHRPSQGGSDSSSITASRLSWNLARRPDLVPIGLFSPASPLASQ